MNKSLAQATILFCFSSAVFASHGNGYVTDECSVPVRSGDSERSKITKMLPAGTALDLWSENNANGYTYIHTADDVKGFILTSDIMKQPSARSQLDAALRKLESAQEENRQLKAGLADHQELGKERDKLSNQLTEIQQASANAIQIKQQRDELQERFIAAEREIQQLKRENMALTDSSNRDWFVYGGSLALVGVLMGFILPRLGWRSRRSSGWDTF